MSIKKTNIPMTLKLNSGQEEYLNNDVGQLKTFDNMTEVSMHPQKPIIVPSHVFLGLILVSGVLPNVCMEVNMNLIIKDQRHGNYLFF